MPSFHHLRNERTFNDYARHDIAEYIDYLIKKDPETLLKDFLIPKKKWTPHNCFHPTKSHRLHGIASFKYLKEILLYPDTQTGWELKKADRSLSQIYDCFVHIDTTRRGSIYVKIAVIEDTWHQKNRWNMKGLTPSLIGYSFHD